MDDENARSEPELFFKNHPGNLALDEIQYAPELIPVIKKRVDISKIPGNYKLTGFQQWGVLVDVAESLAEPAYYTRHHTCPQIKTHAAAVFIGSTHIPGQLPYAQEIQLYLTAPFVKSYCATYIERNIRLLSDVSDVQLFGKFIRLCGA